MTLRSYAPRSRIIATQTLSCSQKYLSRSQISYHAPQFWGDLHPKSPKIWEHDKQNWSMISFLMSCSNFFVMLQFCLSCSHVFASFLWKSLEHDKTNWSMTKNWSMTSKMRSCSNFVYHAPRFFTENRRKRWSMINKIGAW